MPFPHMWNRIFSFLRVPPVTPLLLIFASLLSEIATCPTVPFFQNLHFLASHILVFCFFLSQHNPSLGLCQSHSLPKSIIPPVSQSLSSVAAATTACSLWLHLFLLYPVLSLSLFLSPTLSLSVRLRYPPLILFSLSVSLCPPAPSSLYSALSFSSPGASLKHAGIPLSFSWRLSQLLFNSRLPVFLFFPFLFFLFQPRANEY